MFFRVDDRSIGIVLHKANAQSDILVWNDFPRLVTNDSLIAE